MSISGVARNGIEIWLLICVLSCGFTIRCISKTAFLEEAVAKAEKGDAEAQFTIGLMYKYGQGIAQDKGEAVKWFRKAADQGLATAQLELGWMYHNGEGVSKDYTEALKWFHKAAEQNCAGAQFGLGSCYRNGEGVEKDYAEAVNWFRKAADGNVALAQFFLADCYANGEGVGRDHTEAAKWWHKAAEQNHAAAQYNLGICYQKGEGVEKDDHEAAKWYRKAADQGYDSAQSSLGVMYQTGQGVAKNYVEAVKWYLKAAEQGNSTAQRNLAACYYSGSGVLVDYVEAYKWNALAAAQGNERAIAEVNNIYRKEFTPDQISEGQRRATAFKLRTKASQARSSSPRDIGESQLSKGGTGFFITADGFLISNAHVVESAAQVRLVTGAGLISAKVVKVDAANDLALLKAEGKFSALPVAASRPVKLGGTVATVGFPNIGLQGFAPKLAKGEIASLSGAADDARYFQISVPVQPGNSGGALVDERGNVVGVVSAKLSARAALAATGALPENVNYAIKSSYLLSFLESVPDVANKLKEPNTKEMKFEDVVKSAEQAAVLVLVY